MPSTKTDPELFRQLNETATGDESIEAVIRLRPLMRSQAAPSPEETTELTQKILDRVKQKCGKSETRYNVFKNLGSFVVSAPPDFVRELIEQPEVAAAVANRQPGSAVIAPLKKRRVHQKNSRLLEKKHTGMSVKGRISGRKSHK